jgi:hypothetical protein
VRHYIEEVERLIGRAENGKQRLELVKDRETGNEGGNYGSPSARIILVARDLPLAFTMVCGPMDAGALTTAARDEFTHNALEVFGDENIKQWTIKASRQAYGQQIRSGFAIADAAFMICRRHEQAAYAAALDFVEGGYRSGQDTLASPIR